MKMFEFFPQEVVNNILQHKSKQTDDVRVYFKNIFPAEIVNTTMQHHTSPSADAMRQVLQTYSQRNEDLNLDLTFYDTWKNIVLDEGKIARLEAENHRRLLQQFMDDEGNGDGYDDTNDENEERRLLWIQQMMERSGLNGDEDDGYDSEDELRPRIR